MCFSRNLHNVCLVIKIMAPLLMTLCSTEALSSEGVLLTAFDNDGPDLGWISVNDDVMGGRSVGGFSLENERLIFSGSTNTQGGGFASVRTTHPQADLGPYHSIRLRVRGDGRVYTFRLGASDSGVSWWSRFPTRAMDSEEEWQEIDLPLASFWANRRGRSVAAGPLIPADIRRMGILINDGEDGPFRLEIDWIRAQ